MAHNRKASNVLVVTTELTVYSENSSVGKL